MSDPWSRRTKEPTNLRPLPIQNPSSPNPNSDPISPFEASGSRLESRMGKERRRSILEKVKGCIGWSTFIVIILVMVFIFSFFFAYQMGVMSATTRLLYDMTIGRNHSTRSTEV